MHTASTRSSGQTTLSLQIAQAQSVISDALASSHSAVLSTKFNRYSGVLLHLVSNLRPSIPVIWVDSGYNTRDTHRFVNYLQAALLIDLKTYTPSPDSMVMPPEPDTPEHTAFVERVKLQPFRQALEELQPDLWISAVRAEQTAHRAGLNSHQCEHDGLLKLHPLLQWTERDMQSYLKQYNIAQGPAPYDPTKGEAMRECGLHTRLWQATEPVEQQ